MDRLPDDSKLRFTPSPRMILFCLGLITAGLTLIALQIAYPWQHPAAKPGARLWFSFHLALLTAVPLGLGGIYFVAIQHVSGAAWSVSVRRTAESAVWFLPVVFVLLAFVLLFGSETIFPRPHAPSVFAALWFNSAFFAVRNLAFIALWFVFGFYLWKLSVYQDQHGAVSRTRSMARLSALFLVVFALTFSMSSWDLGGQLTGRWFSSIWAVYWFAGLALSAFAVPVIWVRFLKSSGKLGEAVNDSHLHDLGKFLWGHSIFWAYIAFSQFMMIWFAHIPEETAFFRARLFGPDLKLNAWGAVGLLVLTLRFLLPFFLLLRRDSKRNWNVMTFVAVLVLLGQIVDGYWIALPALADGAFVPFSWRELGPLLLVFGSFLLTTAIALARASLIPRGDPRLEDCLAHGKE